MATRDAIGSASAEQRRRRAELAAIHCAKKQLRLDDETYRGVMERTTGHRSAAELNGEERGKLLDEFRRLGFQQTPEKIAQRKQYITAQARLIYVLWCELKELGVLRDSSQHALAAFIKRTANIDSVRWLTPELANKVIEGLKAWLARERTARAKKGEEEGR